MKTYTTYLNRLWLCLALVASWPTFAQTTSFTQTESSFTCANDEVMARKLATDNRYKTFVDSVQTTASQNKSGEDTTTVYTIPVAFVVYHLGEPVGMGSNVSAEALNVQLDILNRMFAGQRPKYMGPDARIRFVLARQTYDCGAFGGIARVDARSVPGYEAEGLDLYDPARAQLLRNLLPQFAATNTNEYLTVRVMHQLTNAAGWAYFGGEVTVSAPSMTYAHPNNVLLTHEVGHSLFLYHTFNGSNQASPTQYLCPLNEDPLTQGDQVADTDPHRQNEPTGACNPLSNLAMNACTGLPFGLIGHNFMSYGCERKLFTRGQVNRMRSYLTTYAQNLINSPYRFPTQGDVKLTCIPAGFQPTGVYRKGITNVQFQSIRHQNTIDPTGHRLYHDYTCSDRTTVTAGQSYSIVLEGVGKYRRVYVDFNNDGTLEENNEMVWASENGTTGLIAIPANAVTNIPLRMRVIVDDGVIAPSPCSLPGNQAEGPGEVQDFAVTVLPVSTPASVSVGAIPTGYLCKDKPVWVPIITSGSFGAGNQFTVQLSDASGNFGSPVNIGSGSSGPISVTVPTNTALGNSYRIRIVSSNPALTSDNSPSLIVDNFPTATLTGSRILGVGQVATFYLTTTGAESRYVELMRNGLLWDVYENVAELFTGVFAVQATTVFAVQTIRNGCGVGTVIDSATFTVPCSTPSSLTEVRVDLGMVRAYWNVVSGSQYTIQWKEASATTWSEYTNVVNNGQLIAGLDETKTYVWRVKQNCLDGESGWSAERTMQFGCPVPTGSQEADLGSGRVRLSWSQVSSSASYTLRWRVRDAPNWSELTNLSSTTYELTGVSNSLTYEWQVKTNCSGNRESAYTTLRQFSLGCQAPVWSGAMLVLPERVTVGWLSTGAPTYQARWKPVSSLDWTVSDTTTTYTYASLRQLIGGTTYEWQVRANCSAAQTSAYSSSYYFTTLCPEATSLTTTGVTTTSALAAWSGPPNATYTVRWRPINTSIWSGIPTQYGTSCTMSGLSANTTYELQVQTRCASLTAANFSASYTFTTGCAIPAQTGQYVSGTTAFLYFTNNGAQVRWRAVGSSTWTESSTILNSSYQLTDLAYGETYEWQVRGVCVNGSLTDYSGARSFTVTCPLPAPSVSNVGSSSALLYWYGQQGAVFDLRWRAIGAPDWTTVPSLTTTIYSLTGLITDTTYEWQVRAVCSATVASAYTTSLTFTPACRPAQFMSEGYIVGTAAQLNFYMQSNLLYILQWRPVTTSVWQSSTTLVWSSYSSPTYALTGLTTGTTYEWRVVSSCDATTTASASRTFTATCGPLTTSGMSYYGVSSQQVFLNWNGPYNMPSVLYRVRYRPIGTTTWAESTTTVYNQNVRLAGLTNNTTYEWQVQLICSGTGGAYSGNGPTFTTTCTTPVAYVPDPGDTSVMLYWAGVTGEQFALDYRISGAPDWTTVSSLTSSPYKLTVNTGTAYEWRVRALCSDGSVQTSNVVSFTTLPACDPLEPNNSALTATTVSGNSFTTVVLCINRPGDEDWFRWDINGETYYLVVRGGYYYSLSSLGEYILTGQINNGVLTAATQSANGSTTDTFLVLYAADGQTQRAYNHDIGGTPYSYFSQISYTLPSPCPVMTTVKNGSWTDPSTWSCNRVPVATDAVYVLHDVTVYSYVSNQVLRITYGAGGKLRMQSGALLKMGN